MLLAAATTGDFFILVVAFMAVVALLAFLTWFGWVMTWKKVDNSPYTGLPLRYGREIGYYNSEKIYRYLYDMKQYDNRIFDLKKASFCRDTLRIFPDSVNWLDAIRVDWNFLQKRMKGNYVSWGSLTREQQADIRKRHDSMLEFQTEYSSPTVQPKLVEPEYVLSKPGPLYVDITTGTLVGWQIVPGTDFEVLVIQKPLNIIYQKST